VDPDDIEQECLIKIPEIIADYQPKRGATLETFARGAVRNDVRDYLRTIVDPGFQTTE
jgi:DNA-directed RNA polymerase specialized sigma subunit